MDVFHADTNTWTNTNFAQPRFGMAVVSLGDLVLFGGGANDVHIVSRVDVYNVSCHCWESPLNLAYISYALAGTSFNNSAAIFAGGATGPADALVSNNTTILQSCQNDSSCDDGMFCNGVELCISGFCALGPPPCANALQCSNQCNESGRNCFVQAGTPCTNTSSSCSYNVCNGVGSCIQDASQCEHKQIPIVPVVLACVAAVVLVGLGMVFYWWRKRRQHHTSNDETQVLLSVSSALQSVAKITILDRIGSGFFGDVYRGLLNVLHVQCQIISYRI
jgi:hypothetical protein